MKAGLETLVGAGVRVLDRAQHRVLPPGPARRARSGLNRLYSLPFRGKDADPDLFVQVQIQTVTGCNLSCGFCPAGKSESLYGGVGPRARVEMTDAVFTRIAGQLGDLDYRGWIKLHLMNEPTLDPRLTTRVQELRRACPRARLGLSTNGVLLKEDDVRALFEAGLDSLVVDDYTTDDRIVARLRSTDAAREAGEALVLRPRDATEPLDPLGYRLYNRARRGDGPEPAETALFCDRPFRFLYLDHRGRAVLCCSDWDFEEVMGDAMEQSLLDIWRSERYRAVRGMLLAQRRTHGICRRCDFAGVQLFSG